MKLKDFICDKCGECCKHIDLVPGLSHLQDENNPGICKHLKNDLCEIYDNRPDLCNRFFMYDLYKDSMSEENFVDVFCHFCNIFKNMKDNDIMKIKLREEIIKIQNK